MPPRPTRKDQERIEEGQVNCSIPEWARTVQSSLSISDTDPKKNEKLWAFGIKEHAFSSGSDLTKQDYLRLRVLWNTRPIQESFRNYIRDCPTLLDDDQKSTPYNGYISPESDEIADAIYNFIRPQMEGYLEDIRRYGMKEGPQVTEDCGKFWTTRYSQTMIFVNVKDVYDEEDKKVVFRGKIRKSEAGLPLAGDFTPLPRTPGNSGSSRHPQQGYGTPPIERTRASAGGMQNPPTSDEAYVNTALLNLLQAVTVIMKELPNNKNIPDSLAEKLTKVPGLRFLDWALDRLPLFLTDRSPRAGPPKKLMQARVDGYLCRRDFVRSTGSEEGIEPRLNNYPLAILEAKPFTRLSAISSIRWQESAEIAAWVSGLDDEYEDVGLLQSSTSGRKRRVLFSQDRHELYIIIAEYGDEWKQYIRSKRVGKSADFSTSQDTKDLAGSTGFVSLLKSVARKEFSDMIERAEQAVRRRGSTRASRGPKLELPGPDHFCIMQQFGPYKITDWKHIDFFVRRLIGLQVELVRNWPTDKFRFTEPE